MFPAEPDRAKLTRDKELACSNISYGVNKPSVKPPLTGLRKKHKHPKSLWFETNRTPAALKEKKIYQLHVTSKNPKQQSGEEMKGKP